MTLTAIQKFVPILILFSFFTLCCGKTQQQSPPVQNTDPSRCSPVEIGEAPDFVLQKDFENIKDDRLVIATGLTNPQSLVWRDDKTGKTFYLARIMGTKRLLFFLKEVPDDAPPPGVSARFEGHLLRWKHLPAEQARHMASGLKSQYNIEVDMNHAFIIVEGQKPSGC